MAVIPIIDAALCDGCGTCVEQCHTHALEIIDARAAIADPDKCDYCTDCEDVCPQEAISCPFQLVLGEAP